MRPIQISCLATLFGISLLSGCGGAPTPTVEPTAAAPEDPNYKNWCDFDPADYALPEGEYAIKSPPASVNPHMEESMSREMAASQVSADSEFNVSELRSEMALVRMSIVTPRFPDDKETVRDIAVEHMHQILDVYEARMEKGEQLSGLLHMILKFRDIDRYDGTEVAYSEFENIDFVTEIADLVGGWPLLRPDETDFEKACDLLKAPDSAEILERSARMGEMPDVYVPLTVTLDFQPIIVD